MGINKYIKTDNRHRIIDCLLLNASFINNPGLMHGKMGISIEVFSGTDTEKSNGILEGLSGNLLLTENRKHQK